MITDPNLPAPTSLADCVQLLKIGGVEAIKPAVNWIEENEPDLAPFRVRLAHWLLNSAGYILEEVLNQPEGAFGAGGGGNKPPW